MTEDFLELLVKSSQSDHIQSQFTICPRSISKTSPSMPRTPILYLIWFKRARNLNAFCVPICVTCHGELTLTTLGAYHAQIIKVFIINFLYSFVTLPILCPNNLFSHFFSNNLNFCSSQGNRPGFTTITSGYITFPAF